MKGKEQTSFCLPFWSATKLGTKLLVIAFVPFVLTSICIGATLSVLADVQAEERTQQTARRVAEDCRNAEDAVVVGATLLSLYMRTHNPDLLDDFHHYCHQSCKEISDLKDALKDESAQNQDLGGQLEACNTEIINLTEKLINEEIHRSKKPTMLDMLRARQLALEKFVVYKRSVEKLEELAGEISKRHVQRSPLHYFLRDNMVLAIGVTLFVSFAVAWFLARSIVSRLKQLTDKAARLALLKPPDTPAPGSDEIARLDNVFTDMALKLLDAVRREQSAIASAADVIMSIDARGIVCSANPALEQRYGWQSAEVEGRPVFELVPEQYRHSLQQALASADSSHFEAPLLKRDGETAPCLWSTSWSPGQQATVAIVHDVTERKLAEQALAESEARTRLFMQRMPAGLLLLSRDGLVRFANDTAVKLCGRAEAQLIGCQFTSLLRDATFDSPRAFIELLTQRSRSYVTAIACGAGDEKRVQLGISSFGRQAGEDLFLAVMLDDTERSRFEELKQRLIAMLAHDMATPLVTVQSTLSMVTSGMFGNIEPAIAAEISSAADDSAHVLQVFKNMVRFQKLAAGFSSLSASQLSLSDLTSQALDVVAESASEKQLSIDNEVPANVYCLGDADKLCVLGATLLQVIVDSCRRGAAVKLGSSSQQTTVSWVITVSAVEEDFSMLRPYVADSYLFDRGEAAVARNLDLVLWSLLLYQCGGRVSCTKTDSNAVIELVVPCAVEAPMAVG